MYDVLIIGAGVIGAMTAHRLSHSNISLCIAERGNDVAIGASKANSAIVHAGFDAAFGSLKATLNVRGSKMMPKICKDLDVSYVNNGSLVIGFNDSDRRKLADLLENGVKNGVEGLELIARERLAALEPNISDNAVCALYAPTGAIICPYELTVSAIGNAMDNGADLKLNFNVSSVNEKNGYYEVFSSDGECIKSKIVINAAGLYSDEIAAMFGDSSVKVHPRRGEYLLLDKECGNLVSHTIFTIPTKMSKGILVSPTVDNNLLLGPTSVDCINKEDKSTSRSGINSVISAAELSVKGIDPRAAITSFCGLRAAGNTGDFIINMPKKGFVNAAGIESPGLSASPAIAEYIENMLTDSGVSFEDKPDAIKTHRSYRHFNALSNDEKNKIISEDKSFGNIICRCEHISEGEILHALKTNPKPRDLDGIKRRTRAQMGRCQGGFCSPYITEIISKELGIPIEQVTKKGGKSGILIAQTKEAVDNA